MICLQAFQFYCLCIYISILSFCNCLQYAVIKEAKASCFPNDSCNDARDVDSLQEHNCDCGSQCNLYGTCCIDSPFLNPSRYSYSRARCKTVPQTAISIFMVDSCSHSYNELEEIRVRCEDNVLDWKDPLVNVPVTNRKSSVTYKSLFCAICNYEKPQDLTMWQVMLDCSALGEFMQVCTKNRNFVMDNIMFIEQKGMWGLWSWDKKSDWKFRFLPLMFKIPQELENFVQHCRPDLISTCPSDWKNVKIKHYCDSYMGAIYFPYSAFRNIHCAICNSVKNFTDMSCFPVHSSSFRSPTELSFGLLLDVDLRDGDKVGLTDGCIKGQIYDPFAKKCRTLECPLPGYKLIDDRCMKE